MPRAKTLSVSPIIHLLQEMNKSGPQITALYNWCKGMQPDGITSVGPHMNKEMLKAMRLSLLELQAALGPAKQFISELRNSGALSRTPTPLNLVA